MKISVITINYNNAAGLKQTISSVKAQTFDNLQYIVIDGGSSDDSKSVILEEADHIDYWVSEPDSGVYHAMNKGIKVATGDYILFLNSGDHLNDKDTIRQIFMSNCDADLIYGNIMLKTGHHFTPWISEDVLSFYTFYKSTIPHPGTFIKRKLFEIIGLYNERYKIVSDWEFFLLAICKYNTSYKYVDLFVSVFMTDGISSKEENRSLMLKEREAVLQEHFPLFKSDYDVYEKLLNENSKARRYLKIRKRLGKLFK